MGHNYVKMNIIYLKFQCDCVSCISSVRPTLKENFKFIKIPAGRSEGEERQWSL